MELVTIEDLLTVSAGASGEVAIYEVPGGRELRVTQLKLVSDASITTPVEISLLRGIRVQAPDDGVFHACTTQLQVKLDQRWGTGERVTVRYKNLDTTTERKVRITLEGELE